MSEEKGREAQIIQNRLRQIEELRAMGVEPYPYEYKRTHNSSETLKLCEKLKPEESDEKHSISLAGRLVTLRTHGKLNFADLQDFYGKIQLYIQTEKLGEKDLLVFKKLSAGDIVGVKGNPCRTKTGQESVLVTSIEILAKALRPLPEKWHGLEDPELRYRMRYVDLISNPQVKEVFLKRSKILRAMRDYLEDKGFIEVETPMMQPIPGGAVARPFETFHNELGMNMFMRIAPELYLKRLSVGGFEKIFEINRNFRNEGIDLTHNPEFTMLELYQAFVDYEDIMSLTEEVMAHAAKEVLGTTKITYQGLEVDLKPPFKRLSMVQAIKEFCGIDVEKMKESELLDYLKKNKVEPKTDKRWGALVERIFSEVAQPKIVQPTFVIDYPVEVSYLVKKKRGNPKFTERFELFILGNEYGNAYSELTDPVEQRKRFEDQLKMREGGDVEAQAFDEDFLRALEHGMPPTGGLGIGIDRFVMLLTDSASIRDVIFFPTLRPAKGRTEEEKKKKEEVLKKQKK